MLWQNLKFIWSSVCEQAFKNIKGNYTEKILKNFNYKLSLLLASDSYGISAGLLHWVFDNIGRPICFTSTAFIYASEMCRQIDIKVLFYYFWCAYFVLFVC